VKLQIKRDAMGLFWKMFLGMYIAFLIAYMCFYIHTDSTDSRFSLSVGALFAVVGNKYIVDSSLPESSTFTLVDTLHGITLVFILIIMMANSMTLRLVKQGKDDRARRLDNVFAVTLLGAYIVLNAVFIYMASRK
jgi:nitrogen fixation/metabolism regulation signal transduction histidine kinase